MAFDGNMQTWRFTTPPGEDGMYAFSIVSERRWFDARELACRQFAASGIIVAAQDLRSELVAKK